MITFYEGYSDKFHAICLGKKANETERITSFNITNTEINCENNVTLLVVNTDIEFLLKFDNHVTEICKNDQDDWLFSK